MAIRKFVAPTTREAMMQVRRELGDDAVIIANRRIGNRIEILAAAPDAVEAMVERSEARAAAPVRERAPVNDRVISREPARPKVEAFQDFVKRQMHADNDVPVPPRATRDNPARTVAPLAQRSGAGVAMYHDVAEIEQAEDFTAPAPAPRMQAERTTLREDAAARRAQPPTTTLPHSHRAQQIESTAHPADPAVFRRRPAHVAASVPVEPQTVAPVAATRTAPAAVKQAVPAAPAIDIVLEPAPVAHVPAAVVKPEPIIERKVAAPVDAPVTTGSAPVPVVQIRSQAAPIATAARLREAAVNAAAEIVAAPVRAATPAPMPMPQPPAATVAPVEVPAQPATWSWEAAVAAAPIAPSPAPQPVAQTPILQHAAQAEAVQPAPAIQPAQPIAPALPAQAPQPRVESQLLAELQSMRDMLRQQIATLAIKPAETAPSSPPAKRVMTRLLTAGFSVEVARRIAAHLPQTTEVAQAEGWLHEVLAHNIRCADPAEGIVERAGVPATPGQVFALVGPTGVGKTTTVAKLAARFAVRHGTSALGLITLDAYRVAAPEQLRTYGRILGTPVHLAQDSATLRELLATMVHKRLVLIDTCGVSQRDERLGEMLDLLANGGIANRPIQRVLLMNSASHAETLDEAARAWRAHECAGAILTKLDEATRIGGSLDVSLRHRLTLLGLTNGQRVPEDWHGANSKLLTHLALKPAAQLFELADEEGDALMHAAPEAASVNVAARGALHG